MNDRSISLNVARALRHARHAGFIAYLITYHTAHNGACWEPRATSVLTKFGLSTQGPRSRRHLCHLHPGRSGARRGRCNHRPSQSTIDSTDLPERSDRGVRTRRSACPDIPDRRIFMADIGRERLPITPKDSGIELIY
jgi:hypothetical protein